MSSLLNLFFFALMACVASDEDKIGFSFVGYLPPEDNSQLSAFSTVLSQGTSYYFSSTPTTWSNAWFTCSQVMNGKLLSVETPTELNFVKDLMIRENRQSVWTSGAYDPSNRQWRWASTGQNIVYGSWGPGQPRGVDSKLRVLVMNDLFSNLWITANADDPHYSICEVRY